MQDLCGKVMLELAPKESFFRTWRNNRGVISEEENTRYYIREYYKQILSKIDIEKLLKYEKDPILLCYEESSDFCHRHIVAEYINMKYGIEVPEIEIDENLQIKENKRPSNIRKILEEVIEKEEEAIGIE